MSSKGCSWYTADGEAFVMSWTEDWSMLDAEPASASLFQMQSFSQRCLAVKTSVLWGPNKGTINKSAEVTNQKLPCLVSHCRYIFSLPMCGSYKLKKPHRYFCREKGKMQKSSLRNQKSEIIITLYTFQGPFCQWHWVQWLCAADATAITTWLPHLYAPLPEWPYTKIKIPSTPTKHFT